MKQSPRGVPWNSVLRDFTKLTGKYLGLPATLLKNRLWHRCFPVNFVKFLRILFLTEHLWWLLLYVPIWARSVSYLKRAVLVKFEQVSEAVVHKFSSKLVLLKISVKHLCWRHFFIKFIKKRLQLYWKETSIQVFSREICKIFKNTFFYIEQLQWLLLKFNSYFQRSLERKPVWLSAINTRFSWKKYFLSQKSVVPQWER